MQHRTAQTPSVTRERGVVILINSSAFLPTPGFWISHFVLSANPQFPMGSGALLQIQTSGSFGVTSFPYAAHLGNAAAPSLCQLGQWSLFCGENCQQNLHQYIQLIRFTDCAFVECSILSLTPLQWNCAGFFKKCIYFVLVKINYFRKVSTPSSEDTSSILCFSNS